MNLSVLIANILSGGFLKGKRTALIAIGLLVNIVVSYSVGDIGLTEFLMQSKEQIAIAIGLITAAASGNSA